VVLAAAVAAVFPTAVSSSLAVSETFTVPPSGSFTVEMRGIGHGHGMSQYGAQGAARAGKTYPQILAFYYAGTTLTTLPASWIRVGLSGFGATTTVAAEARLTVAGVSGELPTSGVSRYRLVADSGSGLTLQQLKAAAGSRWTTYRSGLSNRASFYRATYPIRLFTGDGSSYRYFGALRAIRTAATGSAGGVYTVNRVSIDHYTAGVVPREMPTSWPAAAVNAQAVAARSYGRYAVEHPQSSEYDICDTSQCQVYGGRAYVSASGVRQISEYAPAADNTPNQVLTYRGSTIFAQFGASDGGWTVYGGQPYLKSTADPYDTAAIDPYITYTKVMRAAAVARYYHLVTITKIEITQRDGNGAWRGRVLAGYVNGIDSVHKAQRIATTGFGLEDAFGVGTTWFRLLPS
jgi:SpoIID/LytB domain protein